MKNIRSAVILLLIAATSCHKRNCNDMQLTRVPDNTWKYGTTTNTAATSTWTRPVNYTQLSFYPAGQATDLPSMGFRFTHYPLSGGAYKIVANPVADYELSIFAHIDSASYYVSTGSDGAKANVTISNGKVNIYCDKVLLKHDLFVGGDSLFFSFNLTEF